MEIRYGIEDITQNELLDIKTQIINNGGYIYVEDIKFFIKDKLPLKKNTLNEIVFKLFGKNNVGRYSWGSGIRYEFFEITNIKKGNYWIWSKQVGLTSKWSRCRK